MYTFDSWSKFVKDEGFAEISGFPPLERCDPVAYYTRTGVLPGSSLRIPANFDELLVRAFSLSAEEHERFYRASFWFDHARLVYQASKSGSFTALISAIESLIPVEQRLGDCPVCARPMGKGATRRLTEFLDEFAPTDPRFQSSRAALYYQFRSQISHGGQMSWFDRKAHLYGRGGESREEEELLSAILFT